MKLRHKKGFTIIELVIVIAVIGILTAVLVPTFINLTNKANEAADDSLVKNLNTALKMEEQLLGNKKNETLQDAIDDLEAEGYILENLISKSGKDLLWNQEKNEFTLNTDSELKDANYWQIVEKMPETQRFSYYAGKNFKDVTVNPKYGFDAGDNTQIASVNYDRSEATVGQTVNIRTNGGTLTINAAKDKVTHYGVANIVDIKAVASTSYIENGIASIAKIKTGRIVVTQEAVLTAIHVVETNGNYNGIKVAVVGDTNIPNFTRDDVTMNDGDKKLVIEVQSLSTPTSVDDSPEYVWISKVGSDTTTDVASSGTVLDNTTIIPAVSQSSSAKAVANEAEEGISQETLEEMEAVATRYAGGQGTESNPYLLATKEHFESLDEDYHEGTTTGKYYKLVNDLNLGKIYPIGSMSLSGNNGTASQGYTITYSDTFQGNLDGANHTLSYNMSDDSGFASGTNVFGLFGALENSTIKDITINADVNCGRASVWVGGIAGFAWNCNLENVTVNGSVIGSWDVGGFFGYYSNNGSANALFKNCTLNANIVCKSKRTGAYAVMGGIVGQCVLADCDSTLEFNNCVVNGQLSIDNATSSNKSAAGYFVGFASDNGSNANKDIKFKFNSCSVDPQSSLTSSLGYTKTISNKTVWCGASDEAIAACPVIKYVGVTENLWSGNLPKVKIYENNTLLDLSLYFVE